MATDSVLPEQVRDWLAQDPDPVSRAQLDKLWRRIESGRAGEPEVAALRDAFSGPLAFGTAGLRAALGPGPNRMNLAVVIGAAAGVARWVLDRGETTDHPPSVVVGFDARHRSADFARASAEVLAGAGVRALLLPEPLPTPVVAFAVRHLDAAAGVMVTASHNPAVDNGYKVFEASGRQIAPPVDREIADRIAASGPAHLVPRAASGDPGLISLGSDVVDAYVEAVGGLGVVSEARGARVAYTAMHGVGTRTFRKVMARAGFAPAVEVPEQADPDPDFPTVAFPNPEEPGALDLGLAVASAAGADVLLANDPDADRLGVAVPDPSRGSRHDPTAWHSLSGNDIGVLLVWHLLRHGRIGTSDVVATTIVSSTLLSKMAAHHGVGYAETLTGFKWISRAAGPGRSPAFGYEEALGYCVGDAVADKDGIGAAVVFAELVSDLAREGRTVHDVLDELAVAHGVHHTGQKVVRVIGPEAMTTLAAIMARLRRRPPSVLAGRPVTAVVDLEAGDPTRGLAPSDLVTLHLDRARVVVRPSGTEPKLKCYLEVVEPCTSAADLDPARARAQQALDELVAAVAELVALS